MPGSHKLAIALNFVFFKTHIFAVRFFLLTLFKKIIVDGYRSHLLVLRAIEYPTIWI